jgi:hypothetical protein
MSAECYRVRVPEGRRLTGLTVAGQRVPILPGEYHVHRLPSKVPLAGAAAWRFVGAHGSDGDVHIRLPEGTDMSQALSVEVQPADAP